MKSQKEIFGENLEFQMDKRGLSQRDLAIKLNVSDVTISNWINGRKFPRMDKVQEMADIFGVKKSVLIEAIKPNNVYHYPSEGLTNVPVLGEIACGDPIYAEENFSGYRTEHTESLPSGTVYYLQANGKSMEPTVPEGAYVLVREQPQVENGEIAAVLLNGDTEATLKRINKRNGYIMLTPDNRDYEPIISNGDNPCKIIGKAVRYTFDL